MNTSSPSFNSPICGDDAPEIPESEMGRFPDYEAFCAGEPVLR